jgi:hypothetical protein
VPESVLKFILNGASKEIGTNLMFAPPPPSSILGAKKAELKEINEFSLC